MVVLDERAYLGRDGGAIPSHQQHLADGPASESTWGYIYNGRKKKHKNKNQEIYRMRTSRGPSIVGPGRPRA